MEKKKFLSFKDFKRKDYGKSAITGLLGGYILSLNNVTVMPSLNLILSALGSVLGLVGLICGIIWVYKTIKKQE